jgi:VanZ family protein
MRPEFRAYLPALAWAAVIWIVGGLNNTPSVPSGVALDKVAHFGLYAMLGWLLGRAWQRTLRPARGALIAAALLIGAADEARQVFNPNRTGDIADFAADAAGVFAGIILAARSGSKRDMRQ